MSDPAPTIHSTTEGGVAGLHIPIPAPLGFVAPTHSAKEHNTIRPTLIPFACWRAHDLRFKFDSSFVLPGIQTEIGVLKDLMDLHTVKDDKGQAHKPPLTVFGHADPTGGDDYNKALSGRRAQAIYGLLVRKTDLWDDLYSNPLGNDRWEPSAINLMQTTLGQPVSNHPSTAARKALYKAYMDRLCTATDPTGKPVLDSSGQPVQLVLAPADFLAQGADAHGKGDFQGCGEFNPMLMFSQTENKEFSEPGKQALRDSENAANRRVLIFLFRPGVQVDPASWPCPRAKEGTAGCHKRFWSDAKTRRQFQEKRREFEDTHDTFACRFYHRLAVASPCEHWLPTTFRVFLKLSYKDPEGNSRVFPPDFPVIVSATAKEQTVKVGKDGILAFDFERSFQAFTLRFEHADHYIGSSSATTKDARPERFLAASEVDDAVKDGYRVFRLPHKCSLLQSDWTVKVAPDTLFNKTEARFEGLQDSSVSLGMDGAPVEMLLDPHWLFVRFEFFDRFFGHSDHNHLRIGAPPMLLDGFRVAPTATGPGADPDTRSNWAVNLTDNAQQSQAIPWIIQRKPDKTLDVKPDAKIMLQLNLAKDSYVVSKDATTHAVEVITDKARLAPSADRLKLYDLPALWKSKRYFTRLVGGGDAFFDKLTNAQILACNQAGKFLAFSLDDIVLMKPDAAGANLSPITLAATDRLAIFFHNFSQRKPVSANDDPLLTREGVYKPDLTAPYFSQNVKHLDTHKNYLSDYPDWTRLLIAQGNLFDVFNRRTPDSSTGVAGARAAVRWVDATTGGNFAPARTSIMGALSQVHPNPVKTDFLTLHPFYEQHNRRGAEGVAAQEEGTGRFDLALIRCCDIDAADPTKEVAIVMNYFRFFFQPNPTISAANGNQGQAPSGLTGAALATYIKSCMRNVPQRWNGPDPDANPDVANPPGAAGAAVGPAYGVTAVTTAVNPTNCNPARPQLEPQGATPKQRVDVMWFTQAFPNSNIVHFIMDIYANCRAFMASSIGFGQVSATDNAPLLADAGFPVGSFTFAHENGHGGSLADEYAENSMSASYFQDGIYYNTPGSPFLQDQNVLMCQNMTNITPRFYWHIAEWLRFLDNTTDYQVKHRGFTFKLPHLNVASYQTNIPGAAPNTPAKPFLYTHVNWPTNEHVVNSIGTRGRCTLFLYKLGDENFSQQVVAPGKGAMDGLLIIAVKMKFNCTNLTTFANIQSAMARIAVNIDNAYNGARCFVTSGTANGVTYTQVRIRFVPRFLVSNFRDNAANAYANGLQLQPGETYANRVSAIETAHGSDFQVTTQAAPSTWTATRRLNFRLAEPLPANIAFDPFFAEMLGVAQANRFTPASYNALVQQVIPGAAVTII